MKNLSLKGILIPTISLFLVCLIVTALLAGTNYVTKDTIAVQAEQSAKESRFLVLSDATDFNEKTSGEYTYYEGVDKDGKIVGYTFTTSEKGYGGDVEVMTGIDSSKNAVSGVVILSQSETPGLGANAEKPSFTDKFKQDVAENGFEVVKNKEAEKGEIEAMTGATITSSAVTKAVNKALDIYKGIEKEGE